MVTPEQVLEAIKVAFDTNAIVDNLVDSNGRIFGSVTIQGSKVFEELDDIRRQSKIWDQFILQFEGEAIKIGPIVLEPLKHA